MSQLALGQHDRHMDNIHRAGVSNQQSLVLVLLRFGHRYAALCCSEHCSSWPHSFAPDFFGSISALTRDSIFFDAPTPASGMDGTERAKLLQNRGVMIQDVAPNDAVGRIAFSGNEGMLRLQKDRIYD